MHRHTPRSVARRAVAAIAMVGTAVAGLVATAPSADAAESTAADVIAADIAARLARLGPVAPALAVRVNNHIGGTATAIALKAAGFDFEKRVDPMDVARAAEEFDVAVSDPLRAVEVARVRDAAWKRAGWRMALRGIDVDGAPDAGDLLVAAQKLEVSVGQQIDLMDVEPVLAAGHERIAKRLRHGGFPMGDWVDESDLRAAARLYSVEIDGRLDGRETRAIADAVAKRPGRDRSPRYARIGDVDLHLPGFGPHYIGFHQSSSASGYVQHATDDVRTDVLPSRGRGTGRTTAVDVTLRPGDDVVAPVSGRVVESVAYSLYGKYSDVRIRIVPDDDPSMLVTVLHMEGRKVKVGDRVEAGKTVIADSARTFPFASQIDGFSGRHWGHVHVEARRR